MLTLVFEVARLFVRNVEMFTRGAFSLLAATRI
jgi:hypothetical protein